MTAIPAIKFSIQMPDICWEMRSEKGHICYSLEVPNHTVSIQPQWNEGNFPSDYRAPSSHPHLLGCPKSHLPRSCHLTVLLCPSAIQLVNFQFWADPTISFPYHRPRYKLNHHSARPCHKYRMDHSTLLRTGSSTVSTSPLLPRLSPPHAFDGFGDRGSSSKVSTPIPAPLP